MPSHPSGPRSRLQSLPEHEPVSLPHAASVLNVSPEFVEMLEQFGFLSPPRYHPTWNGRFARYYAGVDVARLRALPRFYDS